MHRPFATILVRLPGVFEALPAAAYWYLNHRVLLPPKQGQFAFRDIFRLYPCTFHAHQQIRDLRLQLQKSELVVSLIHRRFPP